MLAQVTLHRFPTRKQQDFLKLIDMSNQDNLYSYAVYESIMNGLQIK